MNQLPIKVIKLNTGELLISYVAGWESNNKNYVVQNPVVVVLYQDEEGIKTALRKWIAYSDDEEYKIGKESIVTICSANRELENLYILGIKKDKISRQLIDKDLIFGNNQNNPLNIAAQQEFDSIDENSTSTKEKPSVTKSVKSSGKKNSNKKIYSVN